MSFQRRSVTVGGTTTLVQISAVRSEDAPLEVRVHPRKKFADLIETLGTGVLPPDNDTVLKQTQPKKDIEKECVVISETDIERMSLASIEIFGMPIRDSNPAYLTLRDHFAIAAGDRDAKTWLRELKCYLECAALHEIYSNFEGNVARGLPAYSISPEVAGLFMVQMVQQRAENLTYRERMEKARKLFDNTSIGSLHAVIGGIPLDTKNSQVYVVGATVMRLLSSLITFLLSMTNALTSRPYLGSPELIGKLKDRVQTDILSTLSLLHVLLNDPEDKNVAYQVVWNILGQLGFAQDTARYPVSHPELSADALRSIVMSFLASSSLRMQQPDDVTISPDLFDAIVLSVVQALTTKGKAAALNSSARRATSAATMMASTEETAEAAAAVALATSHTIFSAQTYKAPKEVVVPAGMDPRLVGMVYNTVMSIAKFKKGDVGALAPAVQRVVDELSEAGIIGFDDDADKDSVKSFATSIRHRVLPTGVANVGASEGWLHMVAETFMDKFTSDAMAERRRHVQGYLTRYLVDPVNSANEFAGKYQARMDAKAKAAAERALKKQRIAKEDLETQAQQGQLVLNARNLKKIDALIGNP